MQKAALEKAKVEATALQEHARRSSMQELEKEALELSKEIISDAEVDRLYKITLAEAQSKATNEDRWADDKIKLKGTAALKSAGWKIHQAIHADRVTRGTTSDLSAVQEPSQVVANTLEQELKQVRSIAATKLFKPPK